jgi:hypothetical protein
MSQLLPGAIEESLKDLLVMILHVPVVIIAKEVV